MKKIIFYALLLASWAICGAQTTTVSPVDPKVTGGSTQQFTCTNGPCTWTLLRGVGSLSPSGLYTAPNSVPAQNQSRGCQVMPNDDVYNVPTVGLPVDPHSNRWLTRVVQFGSDPQYHNLKFAGALSFDFFDNPIDNTAPQQLMHFYSAVNSNGYQDTLFPMEQPPNVQMESGWSSPSVSSFDRHKFDINRSNCQLTEIYNLYEDYKTKTFTNGTPTVLNWTTNTIYKPAQLVNVYISGGTGSWAGANGVWQMTVTSNTSGTLPFNSTTWGMPNNGIIISGAGLNCNLCNSGGGQQFNPGSNAILGGADAGGSSLEATSVKMEEWYNATQQGKQTLGHIIRTTLPNTALSARNIWPATLNAVEVSGGVNPITGATNANPVVITAQADMSVGQPCNGYTYVPGCQFNINISGFHGNWVPLNGDQVCTAIDNFHCSININSTSFGSFTGQIAQLLFDFFPYGATIQLNPSYPVDSFCTSTSLNDPCPYAKVLLRTLQQYGLMVLDGTFPADGWDSGVVTSESHPKVLMDAALLISQSTTLNPIENNLQVVNRSSQQVAAPGDLAHWGLTRTNEITVQACPNGHGCATSDVVLQGTVIGTNKERLTMAGNSTYQTNVYVTGNVNTGVNYGTITGVPHASINSTGFITMGNCTSVENGSFTPTAAADSTAQVTIELACVPQSGDLSYRLAPGNWSGTYVDSNGFTWYGSFGAQQFDNIYEVPGLFWGNQTGTWQGYGPCANDTWSGIDSQLYSRGTTLVGDTTVELIVPNGLYFINVYAAPSFNGFNQSNNTCPSAPHLSPFDLEIQGVVGNGFSYIDNWVYAGNQSWAGFNLTSTAVVTNNVLDVIGRLRANSVYGMSISSVKISPINGILITTSSPLPSGNSNTNYSTLVNFVGGTGPYTCSISSGSLPSNFSIGTSGSTCVISGNAVTVAGTYTFTVHVADSGSNVATMPYTLVITPVITSTSPLPQGFIGQSYSRTLTQVGCTSPTWSKVFGSLPTGLSLNSSTGVISGVPTTVQNPTFSIEINCSSQGTNVKPFTLNITRAGGSIGHYFSSHIKMLAHILVQ